MEFTCEIYKYGLIWYHFNFINKRINEYSNDILQEIEERRQRFWKKLKGTRGKGYKRQAFETKINGEGNKTITEVLCVYNFRKLEFTCEFYKYGVIPYHFIFTYKRIDEYSKDIIQEMGERRQRLCGHIKRLQPWYSN